MLGPHMDFSHCIIDAQLAAFRKIDSLVMGVDGQRYLNIITLIQF